MEKILKGIVAVFVFAFLFFGTAADSKAVSPGDYGLSEGDLITAIFSDDPDVYIINENGYKRLFLNAEIFNFYGHLGGFFNVKLVTTEVRDAFETSGLFRNCEINDPRVFGVSVDGEDTGQMHWLDVTAQEALNEDPDFFNRVFCINEKEFKWYPKANKFKALKDVPRYERLKVKAKIATEKRLKDLEDDDDFEFNKKIKNIGKIAVCHKNESTIFVAYSSLRAHLKHGDALGKCNFEDPGNDPDETPPVISNVHVGYITDSFAKVKWTTNEKADSKVWYSTTSPVDTTNASMESSAVFSKDHRIELDGLSPETTYYFIVESSDKSGNTATSSQYSFKTTEAADNTGPVISGISEENITKTSVNIKWNTDENAYGWVFYSQTSGVSISSPDYVHSGTLKTSHDLAITGLLPNTTYYYVIKTKDVDGNKTVSPQGSFTTEAEVVLDETAPVISGEAVNDITDNSANVVWNTNENANSKVWYGDSPSLTLGGSTLFVDSATFVTSHGLEISGLSANTTYYYVIESQDESSNTATSSEASFATTVAPDTTAPVISGVNASSTVATIADITWTTDEPATSIVWYDTTSSVSTSTASSVVSASLVTSHSLELTGLTSGTEYFYFVQSEDSSSNTATSSENSFTAF